MFGFKKSTPVFGFFALIIITVIIGILIFTRALETWDLKLQNSLYQKTSNVSQNIVIVAIDKKSLDDAIGLGRFQNWSRDFYAKALDRIEKGRPSVVVFDVLFNTRTRGIPENALKEKMREMKNLTSENAQDFIAFLNSFISKDAHPEDAKFAEAIEKYGNVLLAANGLIKTEAPQDFLEASAIAEPIQILKDKAFDIGTVNVMPDKDNVIRRIPLGVKISIAGKSAQYTTLPILTAQKFLKSKPKIPTNGGMFINFKKSDGAADGVTNNAASSGAVNKTSSGTASDGAANSAADDGSRFKKFSFVDVYAGKISSAEFKDKIVLIGATAQALQDLWFTPISTSTPMPGVEIQAHAIDTILNRDFIIPQSPLSALILSAILACLIIFISLKFRFEFGIAALVAAPLAYFFAAKFTFSRGVILSLIYPFIAILTAYLAGIIYRYFTEYREKRMIKNAFGHYVNSSVVEEIMKHPEMLKLGGVRRGITVIFTDIENFTPLSESLEPEELTNLLNRYFEIMSEIILVNNGTVDKFEGDAIMAFFNAPLDQPDHAKLACKTVMEMFAALENFNKELAAKSDGITHPLLPINFRAGIATGEAIVGNLGSKDRFDYTAIGDTVNIASRLETANKELKTRALVSETTYKYAKDNFVFREIDNVKLKGKSEAMRVYELISQSQP